MRILAVLLCLLLPDAKEEYKEKLAKLRQSAGAKHYSVGAYLSMSKMHAWAREQYNKTVTLDPNHEKARRKLGYRPADAGGWVSDPTIRQEFSNAKKSDRQIAKFRKSLDGRMQRMGKDVSRQYASLGRWCKIKGLAKESELSYKKAIEYDGSNATARKALGYERTDKGGWLSPTERKLRKEMQGGIKNAPAGANVDGKSRVEQSLGFKTRKRESENFVVESVHLSDDQLGSMAQHAEHTYAMYHKIFGLEDLFGDTKMRHVFLKTKDQHSKYIDAFHRGSTAQKDLAKKSIGTGGFPTQEQYQGTRQEPAMQDTVVHTVAETCSRFFVGGKHHWIHEGTAYHFTRLMKGTAATLCVDLLGTGPKSDGKNYQDTEHWPVVCKVWVRDARDPNIDGILKCVNVQELSGAETVKAWSLIDFMITDHKDKFIELCRHLKGNDDIEAALRDVFGWTTSDLDVKWKAYVRMSY